MTAAAQREAVARKLCELATRFRASVKTGGGFLTVQEEADELIAAYEAAGWHPIETAPRDGTIILMAGPCNEIGTVRYNNGLWIYTADGYLAIESESDFGTDYREFDVPTHWRPLPAPPKEPA